MIEQFPYDEAVRRSAVLQSLRAFDPRVVGTLPLGVAVPASDIDIVCHAPHAVRFAATLWAHFRGLSDFALHQWMAGERPVVARFRASGWPFEIFGSPTPVQRQAGWRHFAVERRLLALAGEGLRAAVLVLRGQGAKTEPAFASILGLPGDPYAAVLSLHDLPDGALAALLERAGFRAA